MSNAAIVSVNFVDATVAVLSALGALSSAPVTNLINPHVGKKWRHVATSSWVLADLGSLKSIDSTMLAGVAGPPTPSFRVRYSTADATGAAGDAHDSGVVSGLPYFDTNYQRFVYLNTNAVSARYARIDISNIGSPDVTPYVEAGRWCVGDRDVFATNFASGWQRSIVRGSVDSFGVGGQTFVDLRRGHEVTLVQFQFLTETERTTFIDTISTSIMNVGHLDMLWLRDPASANLSRDSVWGYVDGDLQLSQQFTANQLYTLQITIRQRL